MTDSLVMNTPAPRDDEWLTPQQAAAMVGITADTIRKWANDGVLPSQRIRPGSHRRFRRSDVDALLAAADQPRVESAEPAAQAS